MTYSRDQVESMRLRVRTIASLYPSVGNLVGSDLDAKMVGDLLVQLTAAEARSRGYRVSSPGQGGPKLHRLPREVALDCARSVLSDLG